jgi:glutamine synthetase
MAESLDYIATKLEAATAGDPTKLNAAVQTVIQEIMKEHDAVVFNGDGYSEEWHVEAAKRGLPNLKTTPDALPVISSPEVVKLFTTYGIFSEAELKSREEIYLEQYVKTIQTEANLVVRMAKTIILPAALRYQGELAATCANLKAIGHDYKMDTLECVTSKLRDIQLKTAELEKLMEHSADGTLAEAKYMCCTILPAMNEVRAVADALEAVVADDLWSLPSYQEMLFIR